MLKGRLAEKMENVGDCTEMWMRMAEWEKSIKIRSNDETNMLLVSFCVLKYFIHKFSLIHSAVN